MKQQSQKPKQPKQQKPQKPQAKQSQSPNLLETTAENTFIEKYYVEIARGAVFLVVLIQVLFIGLLIYNSKTVSDIEGAQAEVKSLGNILYSKRDSEAEIREIIRKTSQLKRLLSTRKTLQEKVENFIDLLPGSVNLLSGNIKQTGMGLTVETATPLEVSLLISNYFRGGLAKEIVINSAALGRDGDVFVTHLEVVFQ